MNISLISKGLLLWMGSISTFVWFMLRSTANNPFYRFGPHDDLVVLGIVIDNYIKYGVVGGYCLVNSIVRSINLQILQPWLINEVQDKTIVKSSEVKRTAYMVSLIHSAYFWFDWYVYMNILLVQFDFFLMQLVSSMMTNVTITSMYLRIGPKYKPVRRLSQTAATQIAELSQIAEHLQNELVQSNEEPYQSSETS